MKSALAVCALGGVMACAATEPAPAPAPAGGATEMRLLVKLAQPSSDFAAIAAAVTAAAGLPARHVSAASPQWHALVLACIKPADCEAAWQRMQSRPSAFIEAVQRDERRRIHNAP